MKSDLKLESQIEAVLFWKAESVSIKKLSSILNKDENEINEAITKLEESLLGRGLCLIRLDNEISLTTSANSSEIIIKLTKDEMMRDLGKAGLETISIILYQGPISRAEIDYIRGVNSQFILRNLLIRGLIEKVDNPKDQRISLYKTTVDLMSYLGISKLSDLPEFDSVRADIENFKNTKEAENAGETQEIKS